MDAIEEIDEGGTITLEPGEHCENETVIIDKRINLVGMDGAVLIIEPTLPEGADAKVGLHVSNASGVRIENIEIQPKSDPIAGAVLFESSPNSIIKNCTIENHIWGIVLYHSNGTTIEGNNVKGINKLSNGMVVITSKNLTVSGNTFTKHHFGAWISDIDGDFTGNSLQDNHIGVLPCAVQDSSVVLPRQSIFVFSEPPAKGWTISKNKFTDNEWFGILLFDGSTGITIESDNTYEGNGGLIDVECKNNPGTFMTFNGADIEIGAGYEYEGNCTFSIKENVVSDYNKINVNDSTITVINCGGDTNEINGTTALTASEIECIH